MPNVTLKRSEGRLLVNVGGVPMEGDPVVTMTADVVEIPDCDHPEWVEHEVTAQWVNIRLPLNAVRFEGDDVLKAVDVVRIVADHQVRYGR